MQLTYQSSQYCEFTILALIDQWESDKSIPAEQIASENNIPLDVWDEFYCDYMAIKGKK
jgi:hypothetical protein